MSPMQYTLTEFLYTLGMAAVAVNALTGVLDAGRKQMDVVGVVMVGCVAALGGGTVRDLLLQRPVFWIQDANYLVVAFVSTVLVFLLVRRLKLPTQLFLIPDAIGLALFTVSGTQIALDHQTHWLAASLLGVITGVLGGVLRDVLCNEVPLIFVRGELYASAAWAGALMLVLLEQGLGLGPLVASLIAMLVIFATRVAALAFKLHMPTYRERN